MVAIVGCCPMDKRGGREALPTDRLVGREGWMCAIEMNKPEWAPAEWGGSGRAEVLLMFWAETMWRHETVTDRMGELGEQWRSPNWREVALVAVASDKDREADDREEIQGQKVEDGGRLMERMESSLRKTKLLN